MPFELLVDTNFYFSLAKLVSRQHSGRILLAAVLGIVTQGYIPPLGVKSQTKPRLLTFFSENGGQKSKRKSALPTEGNPRERVAFNEFTPTAP